MIDKDPTAGLAPIDPFAMARRDLKKSLPQRFYKEVSVAAHGGEFGIDLDGKPVRTPAKAPLIVPSKALAERLADEWRAQEEYVDPTDMPLTRLVNTAVDGVAKTMAETATEIAKFAETDLVCYRAGEPATLVQAQAEAWDPVLDLIREHLGARFICAEGTMYVEQPRAACAAVRAAVNGVGSGPSGPLKLAALSVMTSLTGSVLIALCVANQWMSAEAGWAAAHVDEDCQWRQWGIDREAMARRGLRWRDVAAAADVCRLAV